MSPLMEPGILREVNMRFSTHLWSDYNISGDYNCWTHVKEIPNTKLLVSLNHNCKKSANMELFGISKKGEAKKIYSLGEVSGGKLG